MNNPMFIGRSLGSPRDEVDDTDAHEAWLFDGPDTRLADFARYRLPDELIAKIARAYFQHANNDKELILADSYDEFREDIRLRSEP